MTRLQGEGSWLGREWRISYPDISIGSHSCTAIPEADDHPSLWSRAARTGWEVSSHMEPVRILGSGAHQCGQFIGTGCNRCGCQPPEAIKGGEETPRHQAASGPIPCLTAPRASIEDTACAFRAGEGLTLETMTWDTHTALLTAWEDKCLPHLQSNRYISN